MQHEVTDRQDLLDVKGRIIEEGWARNAVWKYDQRMIKASALRIKEWDYYSVMSHEHRFSVCVTFSDLGFAALFAIAFVDMASGKGFPDRHHPTLELGKTRPAGKFRRPLCRLGQQEAAYRIQPQGGEAKVAGRRTPIGTPRWTGRYRCRPHPGPTAKLGEPEYRYLMEREADGILPEREGQLPCCQRNRPVGQ